MKQHLAERVRKIKPSPTLAINARAKQIAKDGGDIISLSVGEPDFDTPNHIKDAAKEAIDKGLTKYTAVDGTPELKQSIIHKFARENELAFEPEQIIASSGAKQSLYNLFQALLNPGDEVIIPTPYWVSYPDMVLLSDAQPVYIKADITQHFKIHPEQLAEALTDNTRLLILNSPNNPSGMAYTKAELTEIAGILEKYPNVYVVSDEIYEHILWTHRPFVGILNVAPQLENRTILINGVSKAYAMTGWRIGYAAGPKEIIAAMKKIQSQSTSNPCSIAQYAASAALDGDQQCIHDMVKLFKERHDFLLKGLQNMPGIQIIPSHGTFYTLPDVSGIISNMPGINNDLDFSEHLLIKAGVAVVPGSAFGMPNTIRISYATNTEKLDDALKRIKTVIQ